MPTAWFICTHKRRTDARRVIRYCAMDDFTAQIVADSGNWSETEVLGNYALVKVNASASTLTTIAGTNGFQRIPVARLNDPLSSLTVAQANAIRDRVLAMGYTAAEISAALGTNLRTRTLGDVLRFAASRRRLARYDPIQDLIVMDGDVTSCRPVDDVDVEIPDQ